MTPPIDIEHFRKLDLRVGTVTGIRSHPSIGGLSIFTVLLDESAAVLAPTSLAVDGLLGGRVVVAAGLHSLSAAGLRFTRCLAPVKASGPAASIVVAAPIPNGSRLS